MFHNNVSTENILETIISDETLFHYVMKMVIQRITKNVLSDEEWCLHVVDCSIDRALSDVNIIDVIREFVQLNFINDKNEINVEEELEILPSYSITEPSFESSPSRKAKLLQQDKTSNFNQEKNPKSLNNESPCLFVDVEDFPSDRDNSVDTAAISESNESSASTIKTTLNSATSSFNISESIRDAESFNFVLPSTVISENEDSFKELIADENSRKPAVVEISSSITATGSIDEFPRQDIPQVFGIAEANCLMESHSLDFEVRKSESLPTEERRNNESLNQNKNKKQPKFDNKRVAFNDELITHVFYRDRTDPAEKHHIFYSHEDEDSFTREQNREYLKADSLGLTWMEWVNQCSDTADDTNFNDSDQYDDEFYDDDQF